MKTVTHIFWDWNGTLLNDAWLCLDVMNEMLGLRGMKKLSSARYREIFDFPIVNYYHRIGFDLEKETFENLGKEFIEGYEIRRREAQLFDDVVDSLKRAEGSGLGQSILSAYRHETLVSLVGEHGLRDYFDDVSGHAHIYPVGKTPQGKEALERLGLDPAAALLVGDTVHDAEVAEELGMQCILVPGGNQPADKLRATGVPMAGTRTEALDQILERI